MLGNIPNCQQVFERWMEWEPEEQAWLSYIKMEMRYKEVNRARAVYEKFVMCHPVIKNWIRFAKFEEHQGNPSMFKDILNIKGKSLSTNRFIANSCSLVSHIFLAILI